VQIAIKAATTQIQSIKTQKPVIALDGHSSSGKSTLAKDLSQLLEVTHIDTGAMYRAVSLYLLQHHISPQDITTIKTALPHIKIELTQIEGRQVTLLNGKDVSKEIRSMAVSDIVSEVSTVSEVRRYLVEQQREIAKKQSVVMDGRDIGTVVLPDAEVKIFVTASTDERTNRRHLELTERGVDVTPDQVRKNLIKRDKIDSERADSPLKQAEDAILLDTTELDRSGMLVQAIQIISTTIK